MDDDHCYSRSSFSGASYSESMESVFVADSKIEINAELSKSQQNLIKEECPLENPLEETGQNNAEIWLEVHSEAQKKRCR